MEVLVLVLRIVVALLAAISIAGFLSRHWWVFDLLSHLRTQYALGAGGLAVIALIAGDLTTAAVAVMTSLGNAILVLPQLPGRHPRLGPRQEPLRVLFANVHEKNHSFERLCAVIDAADAEIIVLAEVDADAMAEVRLRLPEYPYFAQPTIGSRPLGIGLLSRLAPANTELVNLGESGSPLVIARFDTPPRGITVIGAHPLPPNHPSWFRQRNAYLRKLADIIADEDRDVILVGDFNVTPWSWHYDEFVRRTGLLDSRSGFGLQTTWPALLPPLLRVAIDHCFVSPGLVVTSRCVLGSTGSDHLPIVVDVRFDGARRTEVRRADARPARKQ